MPWSVPHIPTDAPITPRDPSDSYPSHLANYGQGGWHSVATIAERNAIPSARLQVGMACRVSGTGQEFRLTSLSPVTWEEFTGGGGGSLPDITTPGTFVFATVTTDAKGRVTAASSGTDVASEATQQEILDEVDAIATTLADITVNGVIGPTVGVEPD